MLICWLLVSLTWNSVLGQSKEESPSSRLQATHLPILCVDTLVIPLHNRAIDEQAPHDHDHFQHLPQGHLSKWECTHVKAQSQHSYHTELGRMVEAEITAYLSSF